MMVKGSAGALIFTLLCRYVLAQCTLSGGAVTAGIYPPFDSLPCMESGQGYSQSVTFKFFDSTTVHSGLNTITVLRLSIDSVKNLPAGITADINDTADLITKCLLISGTPSGPYGQADPDIYLSLQLLVNQDTVSFSQLKPETWCSMVTFPLALPQPGLLCNNPYLTVIPQGDSCRFFNGISKAGRESFSFAYPCPASGSVSIVMDEAVRNGVIKIADVSGRLCLVQPLDYSGTVTVDLHHLSTGVYFYTLEKAQQVFSRGKIVLVE